jgi:uncharacterized protein YdaU (DUF1376 family)
MHYYQFNIADYRADTAHLNIIEHGIYRQLIDWYYLDEKPIPLETQTVMRRLSLGSDMLVNLQNVLSDFFIKSEKGYFHNRIEVDIQDYKYKAAVNRDNGKLGGRPKKTQSVIFANPNETEMKANKTLTNNQEPLTNIKPYAPNGALSSSIDDSPEKVGKTKINGIPYRQIVELYHEKLPDCPRIELITTKRKAQIGARWRSGELDNLEAWSDFFEFCAHSDFLSGKTDPAPGRKRFIANLEWLTNESNYAKIIERKYHG